MKNKKIVNKETKKKISKSLTGRKLSEDHKKKISESLTKGKIKVNCIICGKEKWVYPCQLKISKTFICNNKCRSIWMSRERVGDKHPNWGGGKIIDSRGYVLIHCPQHPNASTRGLIPEHRLVMEDSLKRYLRPEEVIHHKNKIKTDNRIENLTLFADQSEHISFHHKI